MSKVADELKAQTHRSRQQAQEEVGRELITALGEENADDFSENDTLDDENPICDPDFDQIPATANGSSAPKFFPVDYNIDDDEEDETHNEVLEMFARAQGLAPEGCIRGHENTVNGRFKRERIKDATFDPDNPDHVRKAFEANPLHWKNGNSGFHPGYAT